MMKKPNLILIGIDSLRRDHMSLHGYPRLTTPHIDQYATGGAVFEQNFSPSIPTTSGYSSMFTGMDCFGTDVVALRHKGGLRDDVTTLAELLGANGYETSCVGFKGNPASRGFTNYLEFEGWRSDGSGQSPKAERLNDVMIPELKRLAASDDPFFLFMRHMDPHSPYLPPNPFMRVFYDGNEFDPENRSLDPVYDFTPFADYFRSWFPEGLSDKDYVIAQYDGAIAYMDACIANIFQSIASLGIEEETLVVITSDHGETLHDHDCFYDHHGLYDCTLVVPLVFRWPGKVPSGVRVPQTCQLKDVMPTALDLMGIKTDASFDGRSLAPLMHGESLRPEPEFYITEATWMRKHGWRTPEWKLIHALEPDFHGKPEVELYNLITDPEEYENLAESEPGVVAMLEERMQAHIARRESETGRTNPMYTNLDWHGQGGGPFTSSEEAYEKLHIGGRSSAQKLQAKSGDADAEKPAGKADEKDA
jgi:arylsulfatase A-like enzyme